MDQKKLIHLYNKNLNSMFDDSESEEEIKDSAKDSHGKLNGLSRIDNQELFDCIINMMDDNNILHKNDEYLKQKELDQVDILYSNTDGISYFNVNEFNRKDGDYSIIFRYLKNINILDDFCFNGCKNLKEINLPNSITKLESWCFCGCLNLTKISIPDSVTEIGVYCFAHCKNLTEINIPDSVTKIGHHCFSNCYDLIKITIPERFKNTMNKIFNPSKLNNIEITYI